MTASVLLCFHQHNWQLRPLDLKVQMSYCRFMRHLWYCDSVICITLFLNIQSEEQFKKNCLHIKLHEQTPETV